MSPKSAPSESTGAENGEVKAYIFHASGPPHCRRTRMTLAQLPREYNAVFEEDGHLEAQGMPLTQNRWGSPANVEGDLSPHALEKKISDMIERTREIAAQMVGADEGWLTEVPTAALRDLFTLSADTMAG